MNILVLALILSGAPARCQPPVPTPPAPKVEKVASDADWRRLLARALRRPTKVEKLTAASGTYNVYVVQADQAAPGQNCPAGTSPRSTVFVAKLAQGVEAGEVYPVRLESACVAPDGIRDSLAVDADRDGTILDARAYTASLGVVTHPVAEPSAPSDATTLGPVLTRLVRFLTDLP
jgi:hypothetical protein